MKRHIVTSMVRSTAEKLALYRYKYNAEACAFPESRRPARPRFFLLALINTLVWSRPLIAYRDQPGIQPFTVALCFSSAGWSSACLRRSLV